MSNTAIRAAVVFNTELSTQIGQRSNSSGTGNRSREQRYIRRTLRKDRRLGVIEPIPPEFP